MTKEINVDHPNKTLPEDFLAAAEMFAYQVVQTEDSQKAVKDSEQTTKQALDKLIQLGKKYNLAKEEIRETAEKALRVRKLSDRTIRRYLPDELKDQTQVRDQSKNVRGQLSARNIPEESKGKVIEMAKIPSPTEGVHLKETKDDWKAPLETQADIPYASLQRDFSTLKEHAERIEKENLTLVDENNRIIDENSKLNEGNNLLLQDKTRLLEENNNLKQVIEERNTKIESLTSTITGLEEQIKYQKDQVKDAAVGQKKTIAEITKGTTTDSSRMKELQAQIVSKNDELDKMQINAKKHTESKEDRIKRIAIESDIKTLQQSLAMESRR